MMTGNRPPRLEDVLQFVPRDYRNPPASPAALGALERWLGDRNLPLPQAYRELLALSDGLQIGNDLVWSCEDCRWETEELLSASETSGFVAIGREGNIACWVYSVAASAFHVSSFSTPEDVLETYDDLPSLLLARLRANGLLP